MHAVVRTYSGAGARQLFDLLEEHKADVHSTLQKVSGMISYTLLRQGDGGMSVTTEAPSGPSTRTRSPSSIRAVAQESVYRASSGCSPR